MAGRYKQSATVSQHPAAAANEKAAADKEKEIAELVKQLCPRGISKDERRVWSRVAPDLARVGRLKPLFVDYVLEYCRTKVEMDELRQFIVDNDRTYIVDGRNGEQIKNRPEVGQLNEVKRFWNSMVAQLGMSPATELRFNDKQGSLFDDDFGSI
ncbi:P27 family phage terminase small subunit [Aestuariicella hydrocarbonica]|uniref:P27 family phage terminase small subunit n=1 Tax=Pseudomaricurvus hydrocarbonicus TaxID=1470433 RepID=A0A9E5JSB3_9GAMM|nr:P27 family phage terminase small subunit [Aestuariicella hydrocarbonica]NHO64633.1 P27 family phage terminase small subunit [Aestuariicella hydrocarbonica]